MNSLNSKRILFIAPHADDIEVLCSSTCQAAVKSSYDVHECLACADEYGTPRVDFRGRRLARIRKYEMLNAAKIYGTTSEGKSKIQLHWMPYIDGHVPFSKESVAIYKKLILKIRPTIIFGPDPFFPIDSHPDHINTGLNFFFALKQLSPEERPKLMLFYQSYLSDIALPYQDKKVVYLSRIAHRSQLPPILMKVFTMLGQFWKRSIVYGGRRVDKFRKISFNPIDHRISEKNWNLFLRFKRGMWQYSLGFGMPAKNFFDSPPVSQIFDDYKKNGWV